MSAIPNMRVYLPSDRFQTARLVQALLQDEKAAYVRVGRNAVDDVYTEQNCPFEMDHATWVRGNANQEVDVALIACGELVRPAADAADMLTEAGVKASVLDMYCVKPLDANGVLAAASHAKVVLSVEEASPYGGLGSQVAQVVGAGCPRPAHTLSLPDAPVVTGTSKEVFAHYGLDAQGITASARKFLVKAVS